MKKFLKFKVDNSNQILIDIDTIARVEIGSGATKIDILTNIPGHTAAGAAEVLSYELTFGSMSAAQNAVAINEIIEAIEAAYTTSWTNPVKDLTSVIVPAVSGIAISQKAFA